MTNRGGLFVDPVPASVTGSNPSGMAAIDGRLALASLVGTGFRLAKGGMVAQSATTMQVTIAPSVWVIPDPANAAAAFLSPTDATVLTPAAGPATGSRRDLIVVRQNNYSNGDPDSFAYVQLVPGIPGGSPSLPAVPAGSQMFAEIDVPANASTAAACTILASPTAMNSAPISTPYSTMPGAESLIARISGGRIHIDGSVIFGGQSSFQANQFYVLGTIPAGFRPAMTIDGLMRVGTILAFVEINTAGSIGYMFPTVQTGVPGNVPVTLCGLSYPQS